MTNDLDALLTALYVEIDDHVVPPRRGRGRRPRLSDAELLTLAAAQVLLGIDTEHRWIRFAYCRLGHLFRYLPNQPGYHKRLKAAAPLLATAITHLARVSPSWCDESAADRCHPAAVRGVPGDRHGARTWPDPPATATAPAHSRFYWGLKLYLLAAPDGMPIAWCLADPKTRRTRGLPGPADHRRGDRETGPGHRQCWPTRAWPDARSKPRSLRGEGGAVARREAAHDRSARHRPLGGVRQHHRRRPRDRRRRHGLTIPHTAAGARAADVRPSAVPSAEEPIVTTPIEHYDAVIVGGRCAGAATGMLLARAGLRVLVLEASRPGSDTLSTHALMRGAVLQLQRWDVLDAVVMAGTPAIRSTEFHYGDEMETVEGGSGTSPLRAPWRTLLDAVLQDAARAAGAESGTGCG